GRKRAGDVGSLGIACDGGHLCLVAASRRAPVPEDVSRAVGAVTVPTPTCPHGALVQHAASPGIGGDLHRTTVGRGASKLEAAPRICWFERRTSLYALPFWTGCSSRCVPDVSDQKTLQVGRGSGIAAGPFVCALGTDPRFGAASLEW